MIKNSKKTAFSMIEMSLVVLVVAALVAGIVVKRTDLFSKAHTNKIISATKNSLLKDMDGLVIWFDVATKDSFNISEIVEGGSISKWKNIAPANYLDMDAVEVTNKPTYALDTKDNLPMLSFDGINDIMTSERSVFGYELAQRNQITIFVVNKYYSGYSTAFDWGNSLDNRILLLTVHSDGKFYFDLGNESSGGRIANASVASYNSQWKIVTAVRKTNNTGFVSVNGSSNVVVSGAMTDDLDVTRNNTFSMGSVVGQIGKLDVRELIIFKRELSSEEIKDVERYLSKKWDIKLN